MQTVVLLLDRVKLHLDPNPLQKLVATLFSQPNLVAGVESRAQIRRCILGERCTPEVAAHSWAY